MLGNHALNDTKNKSDRNELLRFIDISELLRHIVKYVLLCELDSLGYMKFIYKFLFNIFWTFLFLSYKAEEITRKG